MKSLRVLPWLALAGILSLTACSSTPKSGEGVGSGSGGSDSAERVAGNSGEENEPGVEVIGAGQQGLSGEVVGTDLTEGDSENREPSALGETFEPRIYFGFDQFNVDEEGLKIVKHYADILIDNPEESIKLVGHTDERGTPEYNLALGEKRAKSVEEAFMLYGVSSNRMEVVTLGEEQPLVEGHSEDAWAKNRRVEIVVK